MRNALHFAFCIAEEAERNETRDKSILPIRSNFIVKANKVVPLFK